MRNQDSWNLQVLLTKKFIRSKLGPVEFLNKLAEDEEFTLIGSVEEKFASDCDWRPSKSRLLKYNMKYVSADFIWEEQILSVYWWGDRPTEMFTKF